MNEATHTSDKSLTLNQNNTTTLQEDNNPDCKTEVYQRLHGKRTTMTTRILPEIKKEFTSRTKQLGLSTCHVIEGLVQGWLYGVEAKTELVHQSPTINLTLVRDVKRVRRYAVEEVEESREVAKVEFCAVCGKTATVRAILREGSKFPCRSDFEKVRSSLLGWKVL